MISDMMAIKAVFVLFCDQFGLALPGDMAMVKAEDVCSRFGSVHLVDLALESIYIEVHIVESTFVHLRLYDDCRFNVYGFRIVKRIALYYTCIFNQLMKFFLNQIQEAFTFRVAMCIIS